MDFVTSRLVNKLQDNTVYVDQEDYYINKPGKIMSILSEMVKQNA